MKKRAVELDFSPEKGKCSKISNIFIFLFSTKMLVIRAGIHKKFLKLANREEPDQANLVLHCFSRPFWQATSVQKFRTLGNNHLNQK